MINLLFISNNPRAELLRAHLQQILKMRIEVVEDFDHGLKDVFEKRPVVVCIQEQIAGVTGESVARHIQLLLGTGAPHFILMHEGATKARLIPGLFNHLVDLSSPFEALCEALCKALQPLLGDHWAMVYTAPPELEPTSRVEPASEVNLADQLVDDFIAETSIFNPEHAVSLSTVEHNLAIEPESPFEHDLPGGPPAELQAALVDIPVEPPQLQAEVQSAATVAPVAPTPLIEQTPQMISPSEPSIQPLRQVKQAPVITTAAEVKADDTDELSVPVEELLQVFEENYRSRKRLIWRVVVGLLTVLMIGLLLFWLKKQSGIPKPVAVSGARQQTVAQPPALPILSAAKSALPPVPPVVVSKPDAVPSFVPKSGYDASFSNKKPGWSRYRSERRDYRLFYADGHLRALQVMVVGKDKIAVSELKLALHELTGSEQYRTDRLETKDGLYLERASVPGHADLLIYRSTTNGPIKAFVIAPTP